MIGKISRNCTLCPRLGPVASRLRIGSSQAYGLSQSDRAPEANFRRAGLTVVGEFSSIPESSRHTTSHKDIMDTSGLHENDILELNVGGKLLSTTRETFTQATGSMLAAWFGPLWAEHHKRDQQGRIFLNCDPYCFGRILSFLRCKLIEDPDHPAMAPAVQPESQAEFAALVRYFGLQEFMPNCAAGSTADYFFGKVLCMDLAEDCSLVKAADQYGYALAHPSLANGRHFIKCCIDVVGENPWMFLGVSRQTRAQENLEDRGTSFGWTPFGQHAAKEYTPSVRPTHLAGSSRQPYWGEGHTLVFKIIVDGEQGFLSMGCVHSGCLFELQMQFHETSYRPLVFAVGAAQGTSVRIAAASWEDWSQFAQRPQAWDR